MPGGEFTKQSTVGGSRVTGTRGLAADPEEVQQRAQAPVTRGTPQVPTGRDLQRLADERFGEGGGGAVLVDVWPAGDARRTDIVFIDADGNEVGREPYGEAGAVRAAGQDGPETKAVKPGGDTGIENKSGAAAPAADTGKEEKPAPGLTFGKGDGGKGK